jgi:eukaryotic-like serine/threonine-protein kinase
MKAHGPPEIGRACPSPEELAAYSLGKLSLETLEEVAAHVACCPRCGTALQATPANDPLLADLRACVCTDLVLDEPECGRLEAGAKALAQNLSTEPETAPAAEEAPTAPAAGGRALPARFGKYELVEQLGKGGMGVVYKARQGDIDRVVALKMILAGAYADPRDLARFRAEAAAVVRLNHPNVITIFDFGKHEGQPYFTMELAGGGSLADRLAAAAPVPAREAADLVRLLAGAVQAAHQQGVLHRDLKPGNIVFRADGTPLVTDFGLAKLLDADDGLTMTGTAEGTASYMSPEQASGKAGTVGPAADVYALGAILYELLCGRPPFKGANRAATLEQVRTAEPARPSRVRPGVPPELEAVCLKCLEKSPSRRYTSAAALADDLGRWLRGEPTQVYRWRWPKRVWRAAGRRRRVIGAALLSGLFTVLAVVFLSQAPEESPYKRATREVRDQLARGQSVDLLGPDMQDLASRWRMGKGEVRGPAENADGLLQITSFAPTLYEMLDDPGVSAYRLRVEMRQERDYNPFAVAGVYFGHAEYVTDEGHQHFLGRAAFSDLGTSAISHKDEKGRSCSRFELHLRYEGTSVALPYRNAYTSGPGFYYLAPDPWSAPGPWREITLEVSREQMRATWQNQTVILRPADVLREWGPKLKERLPDLKDINIDVGVGHPVGIYLYGSSVRVRRFTVEPLGDQDS